MNTFHILTIIIAIVVFSISLIYLGIEFSKKDTTYSPIIPNCPDYWTTDEKGNCIIPQSKKNTGNLQSKPMYYYGNFSGSTTSKGYSFLPKMDYIEKKNSGIQQPKNGYTKMDIPYGLNDSNPTYINFNDPGWSSEGDPYCGMQSWAATHSITWDGLNHYKC